MCVYIYIYIYICMDMYAWNLFIEHSGDSCSLLVNLSHTDES